MTSYQERMNKVSEMKIEEMEQRMKRVNGRVEEILANLEVFLTKSPQVQQMNISETDMEWMKNQLASLLKKEYKDTNSFNESPELPPFNIHVTNHPDVFAAYLDTEKSKEMKRIRVATTTLARTEYACFQYKWTPLFNRIVKLRNPGANAWQSVNFELDEPYLLFGRTTVWEETHRRIEGFEPQEGMMVPTFKHKVSAGSTENAEFMLLLYVPAKENEKLDVTVKNLEQEVKRLTAPPRVERKGFFARFGKKKK